MKTENIGLNRWSTVAILNSDFDEVKDDITARMHELSEAVDSLDIDHEAKQYLFNEIKEVQLCLYNKLDNLASCIKRMDGLILTSELLTKRYEDE